MKKLVLIDGHSILNRAFYGIKYLSTKSGLPTNALFGFAKTLKRLIENGQIAFQYCTADGTVSMDGDVNINGSKTHLGKNVKVLTSANGAICGAVVTPTEITIDAATVAQLVAAGILVKQ